jgi:hypothetical protein
MPNRVPEQAGSMFYWEISHVTEKLVLALG